ncbi:MAG TPA: DUF2334 domain-containing protein [Rariglobus sp.]|nr:DUF2334 domain-containing protein [Rariglobus sp.]
MKKLLFALIGMFLQPTPAALAAESSPAPRIAIIKADDLRGFSDKWDRFIALARKKQVKVSVGVIGNSLDRDPEGAYARWLVNLGHAGDVEFWHHGWDHAKNDVNGVTVYEFTRSGLSHQCEHLQKTLTVFREKTGITITTFGAPNNAMDADTAEALNDLPALTGVFCNVGESVCTPLLRGKVLMPMALRGEANGTGKPDFKKFKEAYAQRPSGLAFAALQFHPPYFSDQAFVEFAAIIDFLKAEGWIFMLPSEYLRLQGSKPLL